SGEVVDIIYQVFPIEKFGDPNWVKDYRKKADHFAKMIIDTILRNTILADKMISYLAKTEKISEIAAIQKLEELTPLAKIVLGAKPKPVEATDDEDEDDDAVIEIPDGAKPGPIDIEFKSKMKSSKVYDAPEHTIKTWGRKGSENGIMGVWGEFVSVDYDICVADGACIEACPVGVYEWFDSPGNPASDKKPLMSKEPDCIFCLACEGVCPPQAIKIFEQK
ncbi:MAG: ferredoxin family protein, partial [Thaumarchaeota archaeon]|nr:ferredoxin family protein [Nitrososphaerota archaeon]